MKKYRVYNEKGYVETTDVDFAMQLNCGTMAGIEVIDFELTVQIPIDKRAMYQNECDHITAEIIRRKLIGDLLEDEELQLVQTLIEKSIQIKQL